MLESGDGTIVSPPKANCPILTEYREDDLRTGIMPLEPNGLSNTPEHGVPQSDAAADPGDGHGPPHRSSDECLDDDINGRKTTWTVKEER